MDRERERTFYQRHLETVILPFWLDRAMDPEYGGYLTCFDNTGRALLSTDKFTWSQGRMVWVLSKLAAMPGVTSRAPEAYLALARSGAAFLMAHCLLDNGNCAFLMDRTGAAKEQVPGAGYDTSIYADCFVILGLSRYARAARDAEALAFARRLYASVRTRLADGTFRTEPYPVPEGLKAHGIPMIMLNVSHELAEAMRELGDRESASVNRHADGYMREIMDRFVVDDLVREMIGSDNQVIAGALLGSYLNPGHSLEDMWFVMQHAQAADDRPTIERAAQIVLRTLHVGWDEELGGLFLFVDPAGGMPHGSTAGVQDHTMVTKIEGDWDNKLWWPHSEGLYATLLAFSLTGERRLLEWYDRIRAYTFATFPNPDPAIGEWIQIRDREGRPQQKVVALPVKDPFHIIRALLLILELLEEREPSSTS
ncbi:MAG: AGE family epimerase/isomerase [Anaerolineae bacterium]|nr:AGE family epimerase/isomerase [Anaerolineae bacterium]